MRGDRQAAADAVRVRLAELGWNPADLIRRAEVDPESVNAFLRGERSPRTATRGRIERALSWAPGSLDEVAAGRAPTLVREDDVEQLVQALFAAHKATTPVQKIRVLNDLVGQVLADAGA